MKVSAIKFGGVLGIILLISEWYNQAEILSSFNRGLLRELFVMLVFLLLTGYAIKIMYNQNKIGYTFGSGFSKTLKIAGMGLIVSSLLGIIINGMAFGTGENIIMSIMHYLPNVITQLILNSIIILLVSWPIPLYYALKTKSSDPNILDN